MAVEAFLGGKLNFTGIARVIDSVLQRHDVRTVTSLDEALAADRRAREAARRALESREAVSS
jgi:1-deoxy-D-xylulose-5-phosphate reductoisomerase